MRYLFILAFLLTGFASRASHVSDTIPYWHISYGKNVAIRGNVKITSPARYEITLQDGSVKDLTISFVNESNHPTSSTLVVKEKNEVLRTVEQDPVMGSYFVVSVRELIGTHQPNVRYELDFYYTDDRGQKNLKLGTLIFIFK